MIKSVEGLKTSSTFYLTDIINRRSVLTSLGIIGFAIGVNSVISAWSQHMEENRINIWEQSINDVLVDPAHRDVFARVVITSAGRNFTEKLEMDRDQMPVNVRRGPGGRDILGKVALNSEAYDVVLKDSWAGTLCSNIPGLTPAKDVQIAPNQICAIDHNYVANANR